MEWRRVTVWSMAAQLGGIEVTNSREEFAGWSSSRAPAVVDLESCGFVDFERFWNKTRLAVLESSRAACAAGARAGCLVPALCCS